jgi:hypothetical protein
MRNMDSLGKKQDRSILLPSLSIESIDASDRYAPVAHENIHELLLIFGASLRPHWGLTGAS